MIRTLFANRWARVILLTGLILPIVVAVRVGGAAPAALAEGAAVSLLLLLVIAIVWAVETGSAAVRRNQLRLGLASAALLLPAVGFPLAEGQSPLFGFVGWAGVSLIGLVWLTALGRVD